MIYTSSLKGISSDMFFCRLAESSITGDSYEIAGKQLQGGSRHR